MSDELAQEVDALLDELADDVEEVLGLMTDTERAELVESCECAIGNIGRQEDLMNPRTTQTNRWTHPAESDWLETAPTNAPTRHIGANRYNPAPRPFGCGRPIAWGAAEGRNQIPKHWLELWWA